ncbi:hypothetical protein O0L34_g3736 [Tuta absoluta]|nr:hypothetical protein O0L34_g3736 [Tuta absoluta]
MINANQLVCSGCKGPINDDLYLRCCTCEREDDRYYDLTCANVPLKIFKDSLSVESKLNWRCFQCVAKTYIPRSDKTPATPSGVSAKDAGFVNTNRRGASLHSPEIPDSHDNSQIDFQLQIKLDKMFDELKHFRGEFQREARDSKKQLAALNDSFSKLISRVESCESRIDMLTSRMDNIELRLGAEGQSSNAENNTLLESVEELKAELNHRDQELLLNDIEITCVPEHNNESLQHITINLARKIGVVLTDKDIVHTSRAGRVLNAVEEGSKQRPRPIVVTLA